MNFLEEFPSAPIDLKITPLVLACYKGNFVNLFYIIIKKDLVKLLLSNEDIDLNMGTSEN